MYLGSYQLGDIVQLSVWCLNGTDTPVEPDAAPLAIVYSSTNTAEARSLPIKDRERITGYFHYRTNLDASYTAGYYTVMVNYKISGTNFAKLWHFQVLAGGNDQGNGISMHFFKQPGADYVLLQTDQGTMKRLRNPALRGI